QRERRAPRLTALDQTLRDLDARVEGEELDVVSFDELPQEPGGLEQAEQRRVGHVADVADAVDRGEHRGLRLVELVRRLVGRDEDLVERPQVFEDALPFVGTARDLEQDAVDVELGRALDALAQPGLLDLAAVELERPAAPGEQPEQLLLELVGEHLLDLLGADELELDQGGAERLMGLLLVEQRGAQLVGGQEAAVDEPLPEAQRLGPSRDETTDGAVAEVELALLEGMAYDQ